MSLHRDSELLVVVLLWNENKALRPPRKRTKRMLFGRRPSSGQWKRDYKDQPANMPNWIRRTLLANHPPSSQPRAATVVCLFIPSHPSSLLFGLNYRLLFGCPQNSRAINQIRGRRVVSALSFPILINDNRPPNWSPFIAVLSLLLGGGIYVPLGEHICLRRWVDCINCVSRQLNSSN